MALKLFTKKRKGLIRRIVSIALTAMLVVGLGFGVYKIATIKTKSVSAFSFSRGALTNYGEFQESNYSIVTKKPIECMGLSISPKFDATLQRYEVHFYDYLDNHLGFMDCGTAPMGAIPTACENARYCRIVVIPQASSEKISLLEVNKLARQLEIKVNIKQNYSENNKFLVDTSMVNFVYDVDGSNLKISEKLGNNDIKYGAIQPITIFDRANNIDSKRVIIVSPYKLENGTLENYFYVSGAYERDISDLNNFELIKKIALGTATESDGVTKEMLNNKYCYTIKFDSSTLDSKIEIASVVFNINLNNSNFEVYVY